MTESLQQLEERNQRAKLALETIQAESLLSVAQGEMKLLEGFQDRIDPYGFLYDDPDGSHWQPLIGKSFLPDQIQDREHGQDRPIFETETDLSAIRSAGRYISTKVEPGINIMQSLRHYTFGEGLSYEVVEREEGSAADLKRQAQFVVDAFLDDNDWLADGEGELHDRTRQDGEAINWLRPVGWRTAHRFIEPSQLTQPATPRQLEEWLGCDDYVSDWKFGVQKKASDPQSVIGYHIVRDAAGTDWDWIPEGVDSPRPDLNVGFIEHFKKNVPRNVCRGISDFYGTENTIIEADKLLHKTTKGAAIQAAIALIRKHAKGTTSSSVGEFLGRKSWDSYTETTPNGSRARKSQKFDDGTVLDASNGLEYEAGLGSSNSPTYIAVLQAALRYAGTRWAMPEFMVSGDASNNNYASSLVAEAPFVKARQSDQRFYVSRMRRLIWKVLRIAWEGGFFAASWDQITKAVDVQIVAPEVQTRDAMAEAQKNEIERRNGVLSVKTWQMESGRDPDVERENGATPEIQPSAIGAAMESWRGYP